MPDLVLARLEDGHVVVDDGVLVAGRLQLLHDPEKKEVGRTVAVCRISDDVFKCLID